MSAAAPDWLGVARAAVRDLRGTLAAAPTTAERARETGTRGEGGDATLEIDAAAEAAVFRGLEALHAEGHRFTAVSEERGRVEFGGGPLRVVIDPLDGSKNAKRGLPHHALSFAVADGPTMADVAFGFVYDFGAGEEWVARRGARRAAQRRAARPGRARAARGRQDRAARDRVRRPALGARLGATRSPRRPTACARSARSR